ncbi:MAG: protein-L-isoaspartate O-methyltransferase [Sphingomonadales bacterium]|nr:protein-L-isoaspartate O-methyltransferase [Sphingomonadales bacterium]
MVDSQLRTSDVTDPPLVAAMAAVPREAFVPASRRANAYTDRAIPLGKGRSLNPPLTIGRMIAAADVTRIDKVLLIGAATGYGAAVLARLAGQVVALESDGDLAAQAKTALAGLANVTLVTGDLAKGWAKDAPYTLIVLDGAVPHVPDALAAQLAPGGRMVAAIDDHGVTRIARGVAANGHMSFIAISDAEAAPLPGFVAPERFTFT